ncbi:hypothetical protein [Burkholderia contaminans]|uniref:hypothetical protein n=1 Tax=Burkholderia contaminans TaxID=488447 RepID=UPI00115F825E|nr:hypothetical protein [Burkholderia contaminans]
MKVGGKKNRNGVDFTGTAARAGSARIRLAELRAATLEAMRRGDGMNKKSARRGTEHKNRFVLRTQRCRLLADAIGLVQINMSS